MSSLTPFLHFSCHSGEIDSNRYQRYIWKYHIFREKVHDICIHHHHHHHCQLNRSHAPIHVLHHYYYICIYNADINKTNMAIIIIYSHNKMVETESNNNNAPNRLERRHLAPYEYVYITIYTYVYIYLLEMVKFVMQCTIWKKKFAWATKNQPYALIHRCTQSGENIYIYISKNGVNNKQSQKYTPKRWQR